MPLLSNSQLRDLSSNRFRAHVCGVAALLIPVLVALSYDTAAQFSDVHAASQIEARQLTNIFATWDGSSSADGMQVELPADWQLDGARALRYGSESVSATVEPASSQGGRDNGSENKYIVRFARSLQVPHELVFQVRSGPNYGRAQWTIIPFRSREGTPQLRRFEALQRIVEVRQLSGRRADNFVLSFTGREETPLLLSAEAVPLPAGDQSVQLHWWMRTHGLDQIVLSTWSGAESDPYALDVLVDGAGRLRVYRGREGQHWMMRSPQPVADGTWHHVSLRQASSGEWTLLIDDQPVDSLEGPARALQHQSTDLAVGGRLSRGGQQSGNRYAGMLDDLRIWTDRQGSRTGIRLTFDDSERHAGVARWPEALTRTRENIQNGNQQLDLDADLQGRAVQISWVDDLPNERRSAGAGSAEVAYVLERSKDGFDFTAIARRDAQEGVTVDNRAVFTYTDNDTPGDVLFYRVRRVTETGEELSRTLKVGIGAGQRSAATLIGNFPNPFEDQTTIQYEVHHGGPVQLTVWTLFGKRLSTIVDREHSAGEYEVSFAAEHLPSGTYLLVLHTPNGRQTRKMILVN